MQYDFDTILDRRGRDALALDMIPYDGVEPKEGFSRIPMWVADMSFPTAPPVLEAIRARLDHPNFGYFQLSGAYFDSIIRWQQVRHGVTGLERQHIGYENGVLGGVSSVVQALTCPGEPILVHSPTYVGFTHTLERLGRPIIHTPLTQDAEGIVINTSNLSEDWVGYCTIYGDSAGAFSPLGMYTTEEVIALGRVLGLPEKFLVKAPSDGLTGLTDEDNLGFTYHAVNEYVRRGVCDPAIRAQIDQKHRVSRFKFQTLPVYHNGLPMALTDETDYYR